MILLFTKVGQVEETCKREGGVSGLAGQTTPLCLKGQEEAAVTGNWRQKRLCGEELCPLLKVHSQSSETPQGESPGNKYLSFTLLPAPSPSPVGAPPKPDT